MARSPWIVNASPLILLGKAQRLDLLSALAGQVLIPQAVAAEIGVKPDGQALLDAINKDPGFTVVDDLDISLDILSWDLGAGETQVIAHAKLCTAERAVLDDLEARRCAEVMGVPVIGTLGIVGRARRLGILDAAAPVIEKLREVGLYVSGDVVARLLREVGE